MAGERRVMGGFFGVAREDMHGVKARGRDALRLWP